jgi:tRNA dimethylallyltransferase
MWLAMRREITVISADSRQIYRQFDLGTAKPTRAEQSRVPHRGIDVTSPTDRYSAAEWAEMADRAIHEALDGGRLPIIVGGTGFYIGALFRPLFAEPPLDPALRAPLQRQLDQMETPELRRWCEALDPERAQLGRAQLLRAIEIALLSGRRLSALHLTGRRRARWTGRYLVVDPGTDLASRIATRAKEMIDGGWPNEVRHLIETVPADAPAWKATGYRIMREFVVGAIDRETAYDRIVIETRQYAKRQRTWFRHQLTGDQVQRLSPHLSGWQEKVDRWIGQFDGEAMNSRERTR